MKESKIPKFRRCVIQNFPFIEEDFDALTDYELLCKIVQYLNMVIDSQNKIVDQFAELKSYVEHYFDNLDVQELINNKLEEMAESGQLATIIAQFLAVAPVFSYSTVADLKLAENLADGCIAQTAGFNTANDGGDAMYRIRTATVDDTIDEQFILSLYDNSLVAELIYEGGEVNILKLGAKKDGSTDCSAIINNATAKCNIYFPTGKYLVNSKLTLVNNIRGDYFNRSANTATEEGSIILLNNNDANKVDISGTVGPFNMKDISFKVSANNDGNIIYGYFTTTHYVYINNVSVKNLCDGTALHLENSDYRSRSFYIDNFNVIGTVSKYANNKGIKIVKAPDSNINNLELMGCRYGIDVDTFIKGSNFHIWGGYGGDSVYTGSDWLNSIGIECNDVNLTDVYLDTYAHAFKSKTSTAKIIVNGFYYTEDNTVTMSGHNSLYQGGKYYMTNAYVRYKAEYHFNVLPITMELQNASAYAINGINSVWYGGNAGGSRFYDFDVSRDITTGDGVAAAEIANIQVPDNETMIQKIDFVKDGSKAAEIVLYIHDNAIDTTKSYVKGNTNDEFYVTSRLNNAFFFVYVKPAATGTIGTTTTVHRNEISPVVSGGNVLDPSQFSDYSYATTDNVSWLTQIPNAS